MDRVRLGTNPIAWSNDDLRELGAATSLETCLSEAREAGFAGIELGHKFPRNAPALRAALAPSGLQLVSGWYSASLLRRSAAEETAAIKGHLGLLKEMGCPVLILAETSNAIHGDRDRPLSERPVLSAEQWPEFGRRLTELGKAVADAGLDLVYHHHMGTVVQSAEDIARLMDAAGPAVKLLLDTGHAAFAGTDPVTLAKDYASRIGHVHCKDVRAPIAAEARAKDWSFLDLVLAGVFTVPGDGSIDFATVLRALPGYRGWLVVEAEQDPDKAPVLRYAQIGHANLARIAGETGMLVPSDRES